MSSEHYDAVIIGSGQAAKPLALALAQAGRRTAVIERTHVGGTCINEGCTPTKTMVASARVAYLARRAADYGVRTGPVTVDLGRVRERKRAIVDSFRGSNERQITGGGVELIMGEARFTGPRALAVRLNAGGERALEADTIIINTGGRPARPDLPGLADLPTLDSTTIMELDQVPEHLLVLGGGYIGLEFGQMFRRFGSRVTVVQRGPRLLAREEPEIADALAEILREEGLEILLNTAPFEAGQGAGGGVALHVRGPQGEHILSGSHLLLAAGRTPNTDRLELAAAGVATDRAGFIRVNERLETNVPGVYAVGDVKGGPAFTHISYDDFRILRTNLLGDGGASTAGRLVPYTVFTDPQLGRVGQSEAEAREAGANVKVFQIPMTYVARALETDEARGLMKAVVDQDSGRILGFAMLGIEGGEIAGIVQIAMQAGLPYTALRDAVFPHPNLSEALNTLFS
ncbi:MAG TPA: mercuric reductase [Roseiflexaceae bacterium]|nr:mercuric reductase [Roseiflexaceae bacterium]